MPSRERVNTFVATVRAGRYVEAIERFYAAGATMRDNNGPPRGGRDVLIAHEKGVLSSMRGIATRAAAPVIVDGDRVVIGWVFEFKTMESEVRRLDELALQTWRDDLIIEERFYYDPAQMAVAPEGAAAV
ncbi:MAG TPA: nuclear transport factor 2 family protein [Caulobacteraceae bacterium]